MKKHGSLIHNDCNYEYEVDDQFFVWIIKQDGSRTNIGQHRPLLPHANVEEAVRAMLRAGGY